MPKGPKGEKRPADANQLAKMIADIATGEVAEKDPDEGKDPAAVKRGQLGGVKGGNARAENLTSKQRSKAAKKAADARWAKN